MSEVLHATLYTSTTVNILSVVEGTLILNILGCQKLLSP